MKILFQVADPEGAQVACEESRWQEHVLRNRPFMEKYQDFVKKTIQDPDFINLDKDFPNRQLYYKYKRKEKDKKVYMKVVVQTGTNPYFVVTAFLANIRKGDPLKWQKGTKP
ncbi:MAG: PBECR2 nuclease fold domain-containing protein [Bacteroidetes bacterium]|nr:PBECR2 nuclease fold domain-containing protein [Bacteroidota bacterium]